MDIDKLEQYAAKLGIDCPFFIQNRPMIATGTGTKVTSIELDLFKYHIAIIFPEIHIDTKNAYADIRISNLDTNLSSILKTQMNKWQSEITNDFEASVFQDHPELEKIKSDLIEKGADVNGTVSVQ